MPEFDRDIHNEIHFAERDEARSARAGLTEMQRAACSRLDEFRPDYPEPTDEEMGEPD